ncbi:MAG: MOSC domain-containing protein [Anaerolineae bacterium]|nr:MOSC domain-containing protein [Anaerolineae bacterium]
MKLISINVGLPRTVTWQGKPVTTGIFKEPVSGPVKLRRLNLEGDRQADLTVHGGADKAVYVYPAAHYDYWRAELPGTPLPWGAFGENFTVTGLLEDEVNIGDRFRIGEAEGMVTQPRLPCYKLGVKFGRADMVRRFLASRRTGFYMAVLKEGWVKAGDTIELISRDKNNVNVADIVRLYAFDRADTATLQRAIQVEALPEGWVDYFQGQLQKYVHQ